MTFTKLASGRKGLIYAFLLGIFLSFVFLVLSFLLPSLVSSNYFQKSLNPLRKQAEGIKKEFAAIIADLKEKQRLLVHSPFPSKREEIFALLKKLDINPQREGVGYYNPGGSLALWLGNVIDFKALFPGEEENPFREQKSSLVIRHKTSVYLVTGQRVNKNELVVFYRLLAFAPQFKAPYLEEYFFLKSKLRRNCDIDYLDFGEDVSGFEKVFSRYKDEYLGQPKLQNEIQTLFFPLRNEQNKIIATITLSSPSLQSYLSNIKENMVLVSCLLLGASLVFLIILFTKSLFFSKEQRPLSAVFLILSLIGLRLTFFPLSNLEKVQSFPFFSPSSASFLSFWRLTKSPADIFLTSLFLFFTIVCLAFYSKNIFEKKKNLPFLFSVVINIFLIFASVFLIFGFQNILSRLILNSSINILRFSFNFTFFLLQLSILLFYLSLFLLIFLAFKIASTLLPFPSASFLILCLAYGLFVVLFVDKDSPFFLFLQALALIFVFALAFSAKAAKRKSVLFSLFFLSTLFIYLSLNHYTSRQNRSLIQNSLRNIILSQEHWGQFLMEESLPEIEKKKETIISFLQNPELPDLSHSLWENTLIAKLNWYSSLEILNPEGDLLSRFSLNVPQLYRPGSDLPLSKDWIISRLNIPFMGKEKEFIVGFKDWYEKEDYLGRIILYLSIDYDMLPFLYSANPYYELLRVSTIPSLNQLDFGFAIFDLNGKLIFNPHKISSGISPHLLQLVHSSAKPIWSTFIDKRRHYASFYFKMENRICSLFTPQKNFFNYAVEFLKLFFFYLLIFFICLLPFLAFGRKKFRLFFWSFSNRVYASFVAISLIPLLLFTFFTRSFFSRIFAEQFIEKAEVHANFARRVMEDYIFLQQEEKSTPISPPEDLVLWISSTIANDVNLYKEGRLVSSSRREFFDSGLLPELIDGEIYYKMLFENNPFYTQRQKIGNYSFYTLTIPYSFLDSLLLISLPFPFERQEIAEATRELIEFLFFISFFFIAVVLVFARGIGAMIVTPIKKLLAGTKEVSLGNLEISINHRSKDEMKTLVDGFNAMIKNLKRHEQELAEMSKKAAWAEMARKVAHEIKNPLTPIQLSAEHLLQVYEDKKGNFDQALKESTSYIINEVENLRKIAQEFLEFSKETVLHKVSLDLKEVIEETIAPYKKMLSERIHFQEKYKGKDFIFEGDRSKIKIALRNIIINAIEAICGKGEIGIQIAQEKEDLNLEIKDTGIGMEKGTLERIFEPYFSTKEVGTGLGLPIAKKIIEDHGGTIQVSSELKKGTKISISFPRHK